MKEQNNLSFRILFVITTPKLSKKASEIFLSENIPVHYVANAIGTATSEMLDILGLGTPDKAVLISMLPTHVANHMLRKLYNDLMFAIPGNGIAFTLHLTGCNNKIMKMLQSLEKGADETTRKEEILMPETKYVMITTIVNSGFTEEVMNAARSAGARGGTVIHSRGVTDENANSVWGIGLQEEKEIVIIVSDTDNKLDIMQAISSACGINTEAKGIVMSLPIDSCVGLGQLGNN